MINRETLLNLIKSWVKHPAGQICKHAIACDVLSAMETAGEQVTQDFKDLIKAIVDTDDEEALRIIDKMIPKSNLEENKMIKREDLIQEQMLRSYIRKVIMLERKEIENETLEENKLRGVIRQLLKETDVEDEVPHHSTGINVLEDLLKKIVPILEGDFKSLTTDKEQRDSFRAHIINAVQKSLAPEKNRDDAGEEKFIPVEEVVGEGEADVAGADVNVKIGGDVSVDAPQGDEEAFIDIDKDKGPSKEEEDEAQLNDFSLEGQNETGRNMALKTYDKIDSHILDAYSILEDEEDENTFYDYLITNLKLYFDKFENELQPALEEPTTPEYEDEKDEMDDEEVEGDAAELGLTDAGNGEEAL